MKARFSELGGVPVPTTPADFGKFIADETEKWAKVVKFANIKPEWIRAAAHSINPVQRMVAMTAVGTSPAVIVVCCTAASGSNPDIKATSTTWDPDRTETGLAGCEITRYHLTPHR
jgi:hypothetical protein